MQSPQAALELILSHAHLLSDESVPLEKALHRVLREDIYADTESPAFDTSAMDGYALRSCDVGTDLFIIAEIKAGDSKKIKIEHGQCVRIFTGSPLPDGADCVIMQENATVKDRVLEQPIDVRAGENVRKRGENYSSGEVLIKKNVQLTPLALASLASCGVVSPKVSRLPRIIHFVSGDELIAPSQTPKGGQIRDSNSTLISALLQELGIPLLVQSSLPDSLEISIETVEKYSDYDVLLFSGGASVGAYDFARPLLKSLGFQLHLDKINLRPGKPLIFATKGKKVAFAIPGNPVSHAVIFHLMLTSFLKAMQGISTQHFFYEGRMEESFSFSPSERETYWFARTTRKGNVFYLKPLSLKSSGDIVGIVGSNTLLRIPPHHHGKLEKEDAIEFLWFGM